MEAAECKSKGRSPKRREHTASTWRHEGKLKANPNWIRQYIPESPLVLFGRVASYRPSTASPRRGGGMESPEEETRQANKKSR